MVKKIKHFVIFVLFSFVYSLLSGKEARADYKVCLTPQDKSGTRMYHGKAVSGDSAQTVSNNLCYE